MMSGEYGVLSFMVCKKRPLLVSIVPVFACVTTWDSPVRDALFRRHVPFLLVYVFDRASRGNKVKLLTDGYLGSLHTNTGEMCIRCI